MGQAKRRTRTDRSLTYKDHQPVTDDQVRAIEALKRAVAFFAKVKASPADERAAVGCDHWDWLETASCDVAKAF
jgi:hypothetical protein